VQHDKYFAWKQHQRRAFRDFNFFGRRQHDGFVDRLNGDHAKWNKRGFPSKRNNRHSCGSLYPGHDPAFKQRSHIAVFNNFAFNYEPGQHNSSEQFNAAGDLNSL
jgi:hypothetical protein